MSDERVHWRRLDARSVVVASVPRVASIWVTTHLIEDNLPFGRELVDERLAQVAGVLTLLTVLRQTIRVLTTRYVVTEHSVRMRTGWLSRRSTVIDRGRVRAVVLTSGVLARPLGLSRVLVGTAEGLVDASVDLAWIPTRSAQQLRVELLSHVVPNLQAAGTDVGVLATGRTRWALWAPFTALSVSLWAGTYAVLQQQFTAYFAWIDTLRWLMADRANIRAALRALVVVPVVVGVVGSVLVYLEAWWGFTLRRERRGTLGMRYGLLARRSTSLDETRVRGLELVQPFLPRIVGRARLLAVTAGTGSQESLRRHLPLARRRTLLPLGPSAAAGRAAAAVLGRDLAVARLLGHPVQARYKRYRWAALLTGATLLVVGLPLRELVQQHGTMFVVSGLVLLAAALVVAEDNYRALGHLLDDDLLLVRSGTVRRTTTVLQRRAVVGWVFRQSWFQHRLGLVTAIGSTTTGQGSYALYDAGCADAVELACEVTPALLARRHRPG